MKRKKVLHPDRRMFPYFQGRGTTDRGFTLDVASLSSYRRPLFLGY
ncbi:hypothetical protein [Octadecabacter arcticus]|jgi:hypothetical protein|nr:hypothetical protein [Octadecabacter arcticus]